MSELDQRSSGDPGEKTSTGDGTRPMVTIERVAVQLGDVEALAGVSAHVAQGSFLGLIGPNGAGKTTLLRTITDVVTPDSGSVAIDDFELDELSSREVSRKVAVVPQDSSLAFDFDVREIVAMGRTPYIGRFSASNPADRQSVERAMEHTQVKQFASRSISEVSGGERQRVLLARAIAQETPVLLLDEPTSSLDINHQVRTLELVSQLVEEGKTVIAAIHDLNLAARYCDELLLLDDGRVTARGRPESVLTTENVRSAFGTPSLVAPHSITGSVHVTPFPDRQRGDPGKRVHLITTDGEGSEVLFRVWAAGHDVTLGPVPPGDVVAKTAENLGAETVIVDPWESVGEKANARIEKALEKADVVLLVDIDLRQGLLESLRAARSVDRVILLEDRPLRDRNRAGESARHLYATLRQNGVVLSRTAFLEDIEGSLAASAQASPGEETAPEE